MKPLLHFALALAAASVLVFLWLARIIPRPQAFAAGLFLGVNPLSLTLVGLRQYAVLHVLAFVAGLWALVQAVGRWPDRRAPMALAGVVWGLHPKMATASGRTAMSDLVIVAPSPDDYRRLGGQQPVGYRSMLDS